MNHLINVSSFNVTRLCSLGTSREATTFQTNPAAALSVGRAKVRRFMMIFQDYKDLNSYLVLISVPPDLFLGQTHSFDFGLL